MGIDADFAFGGVQLCPEREDVDNRRGVSSKSNQTPTITEGGSDFDVPA